MFKKRTNLLKEVEELLLLGDGDRISGSSGSLGISTDRGVSVALEGHCLHLDFLFGGHGSAKNKRL